MVNLKRAARTALPGVALVVSSIGLHAQAVSWCPPSSVHTAASRQPEGRLSPATIARIDSAVAAEMRRERIPGLSVAIATNNQLRWERGYGFADLEACVPATPTTTYRLASVSKTISAVAVMQLVEQGHLDLDAPIQRYVPTFPAKNAPVTARQLLSHLSGIRHYQGDEELSVREYPSLTAALVIFENDSLLQLPGARFTYSTYGYTLLGAALEAVTGKPFVEYLRAHIFAPAGITSMRDDSVAAVIPNRARGYSRDSSGVIRNAAFLNSSYKIPGGGLISTAGDLARFAARLQSGDFVKPTTFTQMATKARTTDGSEVPYGYGLILGEIADILPGAVWHGGVQQGFTTMVYMLPKERIALAVLANLEGIPGSLAPFTNELARIVRDDGRRVPHAKRQR
jgi:serine beta-lactamase-like protein LACTB, mitochondrial